MSTKFRRVSISYCSQYARKGYLPSLRFCAVYTFVAKISRVRNALNPWRNYYGDGRERTHRVKRLRMWLTSELGSRRLLEKSVI
jgi:hypothetical protein